MARLRRRSLAGELPVVAYVASNVVPWLDFILFVKVSMVALLPLTSCATFLTAFTTPQPVQTDNYPSQRQRQQLRLCGDGNRTIGRRSGRSSRSLLFLPGPYAVESSGRKAL